MEIGNYSGTPFTIRLNENTEMVVGIRPNPGGVVEIVARTKANDTQSERVPTTCMSTLPDTPSTLRFKGLIRITAGPDIRHGGHDH